MFARESIPESTEYIPWLDTGHCLELVEEPTRGLRISDRIGNGKVGCQDLLTVVHHGFSGSNEVAAVKSHEKNDQVAQHSGFMCFLDLEHKLPPFPWWQAEEAVNEDVEIPDTFEKCQRMTPGTFCFLLALYQNLHFGSQGPADRFAKKAGGCVCCDQFWTTGARCRNLST